MREAEDAEEAVQGNRQACTGTARTDIIRCSRTIPSFISKVQIFRRTRRQLVDNWSRKTWTVLLKDRNEILPKLKKWKLKAELETGRKVKAARTDNAPEILEALKEWEESDGVSVQSTEPYTSAQNGTAERSIQFTEASIRCMIDDAQLPVEFWCEAAQAQAYTRARMRRGPIFVLS